MGTHINRTETKGYPVLLLVEDNRAAAALMATSLKHLGCRTLVATNGEKALEVLRAEPSVDLVITDVSMPGIDGLELLRRIKASEELKNLPVIICSGENDPANIKEGLEIGCARYLIKPVHSELLFEEITSILGHPSPAPPDSPTEAPQG